MINLAEGFGKDAAPDARIRFDTGDIVAHRRYGYRGVVVAFDERFSGSEEWYQKNQTQPSKDQPWYHVLVHGAEAVTYAAQSSLEADPIGDEVDHPLVHVFFSGHADGKYVRNGVAWEGF